MKRSPVLLQVLASLRIPPDSGAPLRSHYLAQELARDMTVLRAGFGCVAGNEGIVVVPHERKYSIDKLLRGATGPIPLPLLNYTSRNMTEAITNLLSQYDPDVVQFESVHMSVYVEIVRSICPRALIVGDWHYIDSEFMLRYASNCANLARKLYAARTARLLARAEKQFVSRCNMSLSVCEREQNILKGLAPEVPAYVIPNGIDCSQYSVQMLAKSYDYDQSIHVRDRSEQRRNIIFVGSMDYQPNVDAVVWFAENIWPALSARCPDLRFLIVGRDPTMAVRRLAQIPDVEVSGTVKDVRAYYHRAVASVVPLHFGSGTRIKILEAMAASVPVVSTCAGAEGLRLESGTHYLEAETPRDFISAIEQLYSDPSVGSRLAVNSRQLAEDVYDWGRIGSYLRGIYHDALLHMKPQLAHQSASIS